MKRINLKTITNALSSKEMKAVTGGIDPLLPVSFPLDYPDGVCRISEGHCYFAYPCFIAFGCEHGTCIPDSNCP